MAPKDRDSKLQKSGVIYKYKCPEINCTEEYIEGSGRTFGDRYKEYLEAPSPIHLHTTTTGHPVSPDCFSIVAREAQGMARNIKEVMYIRIYDPSLNRYLGKIPTSTCLGPSTTGCSNTSSKVTPTNPFPHHKDNNHPLDTPILPKTHGWGYLLPIGKYPKCGCLSPNPYTPHLFPHYFPTPLHIQHHLWYIPTFI